MPQGPIIQGGEETASTLNEVIETCKDGENGFRTAAVAVEDSNLGHLLESLAQQRAEFAAELQTEVRRLAHDAVDSEHTTAALHRGWMDIKAGLTGRDDAGIIAECERGEDASIQVYRKAVESNLPADIRSILQRQLLDVEEAYNHIRSLERTHARNG